MASMKLTYISYGDLQDWAWEQMDQAEVSKDSGELDSISIDLYPTGIRIDFHGHMEDRFELGDIEDVYSYSQRGPGTFSLLKKVLDAGSAEEFFGILESAATDFHPGH